MDSILVMLPQLIVTGLTIGSIYALLSLCFYVVHAGTGVINFAQGDFVVIGLVMVWTTVVGFGLPLPIALALAIAFTFFTIVGLERVTLNPVARQDPIIPLLVTLALGTFIRGVIQVLWGSQPRAVPYYSGADPFTFMGAAVMPQSIWIVAGTCIVLLVLYFFFSRTMFGLAMRASASDMEGAQVIGVNPRLVSLYAFGLSALISAVTAAVIAPNTNADPFIGLEFSLKGFAGAVIGGIDRPHTAVLGGLFIGLLEALAGGLISSEYKNLIVFGCLIAVLVFKPNGLLGGKA